MPAARVWTAWLRAAVLAVLAGALSYHYLGGRQLQRLDFALTDLQGRRHTALDWDGRVVVLNFWAPWCEPCRDEMPMLNSLQKEYGGRGLQVLGLTLDEPAAARMFAAQIEIAYPLLVGLEEILDLQSAYGDTRLPFTVVIDRTGRVTYRQAGELKRVELLQVLEPLF